MKRSPSSEPSLVALGLAFVASAFTCLPAWGQELTERWRVRIGQPPAGPPVVGDGAVYLVTEEGDLVSVGLDGREHWRTLACAAAPPWRGDRFAAPPLVAGESLVVGSRGGILCAHRRSDGAERWRSQVGPVGAPLALLVGQAGQPDSVLTMSQADGALLRVDLETGQEVARSASTNRCDGGFSVQDELIAYANCDAALYLVTADKLEVASKTELRPDGEVSAGVAMDSDAAYLGDRSGRIYAVSLPEGEVVWVDEQTDAAIVDTPAVVGELVYHGADDGTVAALERARGRSLWRSAVDGTPSTPVPTEDHRLLVSAGGALHVLDASDGSILQRREVSDEIGAPVLIGDLVLVGTADGFLVAFAAGQQERSAP